MCNRLFADLLTPEQRKALRIDEFPELLERRGRSQRSPSASTAPKEDLAPTEAVPVVRSDRRAVLMRWGLLPAWRQEEGETKGWTCARGETVHFLRSFAAAFRHRRGVVATAGFYEWKTLVGGKKQRYRIQRADGAPLLIAALWESLTHPVGGMHHTFALVTCAPNEAMQEIQDRMPVVLDPVGMDQWLDPTTPLPQLRALLRPCPSDWLVLTTMEPLRKSGPGDLDLQGKLF